MVQFTLPKNSTDHRRQDLAETGRRQESARIPHLSLEPGRRAQSAHRHLFRRSRRLRADGSRCALVDQEQGRSDAHLPPLVPRGDLRLLRDEYRRDQYARLHQGHERDHRRRQNLSAAAYVGGQGSGAGYDQLLRAGMPRSSHGSRPTRRRPRGNGRRPRKTAPSSTGFMNVSCAPAARRPARAIGGTVTAISVLPRCCRPIAGSSIHATRRPASGSTISKIRSASIAATRS